MTDGWTIKERFDHEIDAVIDSGECGTIPTTVIDLSDGAPEVIRVGAGDPSSFE
jgi:tRNA A37 threonylcarbamoyladenosine synthetase subunit TsaC/SUA5/YrdC